METKTHYRKFLDFRIEALNSQVRVLQKSIESYVKDYEKVTYYDRKLKIRIPKGYYDISFLMDDLQAMYGLMFVAFQIYINGTVGDVLVAKRKEKGKDWNLKNYDLYKMDDFINKSTVTRVELIIALANYFKHIDDPDPNIRRSNKNHDRERLEQFTLLTRYDAQEIISVLNEGFEIIVPDNKPETLILQLVEWRSKIWEL